eukprot:685641-Ditylum_brightwellii.AAC.1
MDFLLSDKLKEFIKESLLLKAVLQPQLLVKVHKKLDEKSENPMWMGIPAAHFTTSFSKLEYSWTEKVLMNHGVHYSKHIIFQSLDLKEKLRKLKLNEDKIMVMSLDISKMYALVRVRLRRKAI